MTAETVIIMAATATINDSIRYRKSTLPYLSLQVLNQLYFHPRTVALPQPPDRFAAFAVLLTGTSISINLASSNVTPFEIP